MIIGLISGLLAAWFLAWFGFDVFVIGTFREMGYNISINVYYLTFSAIGILSRVIRYATNNNKDSWRDGNEIGGS